MTAPCGIAASHQCEQRSECPDDPRNIRGQRAGSGFYAGSMVSACRRHGVAFSVTARKNTAIVRAISQIPDDAWTPIPYWIDGGANVAERSTRRSQVRSIRPQPG